MDELRDVSTTDERARGLAEAGDQAAAATLVLRELGPEIFGFLRAALGSSADADEVSAATSERIWRSLPAFQWRSSVRTWAYVIARNEAARFQRGARRRNAGRVTPSQLEDVVAIVRTETRSALRTEKRDKIRALREELSIDDRTLLILRVDRDLEWTAVARIFLGDEASPDEVTKREAARLRKRFQLVRLRLVERAREEGLLT
jgi:RNA polymerase sigma-70 factor (ECF subfamily)